MKSIALGHMDEWMVFGDHQLTAAGNVKWPEIPNLSKGFKCTWNWKERDLALTVLKSTRFWIADVLVWDTDDGKTA
jgi:hypothetical protein